MVDGRSGLRTIAPKDFQPEYWPSKYDVPAIIWPNGARMFFFSAEEPERKLRGNEFDFAWCEELAAWRYLEETWDNLRFGLRAATGAKTIVTSTPKPRELIKNLMRRTGEGGDVFLTTGSTYENADNLPEDFLAELLERYEGTRLGRQELSGEILEDAEGALWARERIELSRRTWDVVPPMIYIAVGVDPPGGATEAGIVVVGLGRDLDLYTLGDYSTAGSPKVWATAAVNAYFAHDADKVVAEANYGGDMVSSTIAGIPAKASVPVEIVHASRGKAVRAEPVASYAEQGRDHHVGTFPALEDELCFVAETPVLTREGWVPIAEVGVGEFVWTRAGWRSVRTAGLTSKAAEVWDVEAGGLRVTATPSHPFFSAGRFVPLTNLLVGDTLRAWLTRELRTSSPSNGTGDSGIEPEQAIGRTETESSYTDAFGKRPTDLSLRALTSTMSTGTRRTGVSITSNSSPARTTRSVTSTGSPSGRSSGEAPTCVDAGERTRSSIGERAALAERSSRRPVPADVSALALVDVAITAITRRLRPEMVYNLSVEGEPEYLAGGFLVHNCQWEPGDAASPNRLDAKVWAATKCLAIARTRHRTAAPPAPISIPRRGSRPEI